MKVYLGQAASPQSGGLYRVFQGLFQYLPKAGVEIVDNIAHADVINQHVAIFEDVPEGVPLVVSSHGLLWAEDSWGKYAAKTNKDCLESYLIADVVTAPSSFVAKTIARHTLVNPQVVQHGIDPEVWFPGEDFGYVLWNKARVDPANDPSPMQALADRAKNTQFISTFGKQTHNVEITGKVSPDEMLDFVRNAGVYLSTTKESGGPCFGVLEALSCGVPVLAWDYGGTSEAVVHKETGYLAEPENYEDLYQGLRYCIENRERLGTNARQSVLEKYTWETTIQGYVNAYQQAMQEYAVETSVVIPCYNLGQFLPNAIESVQAQTYDNWELIIVNDASTDNSREIAEEYANKDSRITVINNSYNLHVSDSRNRGVLNARGRYILPLDADDRLEKTALARMTKVLNDSRRVHAVSGKLGLFREDNLQQGRVGEWPNDTDIKKQISGYNRVPYCALYRKQMWENIGGYRRRIRVGVEDADFWTRALSYGYNVELLEGTPILHYTLRSDESLGKKNKQGSKTWLSWFAWERYKHTTPAGSGLTSYHVTPVDQPDISIIVPVGPNHAHHIQACVDSVLSQSFNNWEVIVVNDTGERLENSPYINGLAFVRVLDGDTNEGVAAARNKGVKAARASKLVFLDVDDVLQPNALAVLKSAHEQVGGWIYGDWYSKNGDNLKRERAEDWNAELLTRRSLCPITGLYEKAHAELVGGFDLTLPGWEDWDFHLKLLENGICGTRVAIPLLTYNMNLGFRREENFNTKDILLQYIIDRHPLIYEDRRMGCSKCGGKPSVQPTTLTQAIATSRSIDTVDNIVVMKYMGPEAQTRTFKSKHFPGVTYRVNNRHSFQMFEADAKEFENIKHFERVKREVEPMPIEEPTHVLSSDTPPTPKRELVTELDLTPETAAFLLKEFMYQDQLRAAGDSDILKIKGIGPTRLKEIKEALK